MNRPGAAAGSVAAILLTVLLSFGGATAQEKSSTERVGLVSGHVVMESGGIIRMDSTRREIFLVFTGHEFADGGSRIREILRHHGVRASFFLTGDFYRNPRFRGLIRGLRADGHYLGGHSNRHLLYASWTKRDSLLVSKKEFLDDLAENYGAMGHCGVMKDSAPWFLPPYEWYNDTIAAWVREAGLTLVDFTPGTRSNADYTIPEERNYVSSSAIEQSILFYEKSRPGGLCGFLLLTHIGTDPRRTDKLYNHLDGLILELKRRGYAFRRLPPYGLLRSSAQ